MKKVIKYVVIGAGVCLLVWTFVFLYKKSEKVPEVFTWEQAKTRDIIKKTVATGSVQPKNETEIRPRVSGIIEELYVVAGKEVRKGDRIAKIRIVPNMAELNNAEIRLKQSEVSLSDRELDYNRTKSLFQQGVASKLELQKAEIAFKQAKEENEGAKNHISIVKDGINKQSNLSSNTIVCSTIDGMVLNVPVKVGHSVIETNAFNAGTTIASVADMAEMEFIGKVDETEVGKIAVGMPLLLTIGAIEGATFDATLTYIAPKGVLENGAIQFEIKANVKLKKQLFVRAGYSANADIVLQRVQNALSIEEKNLIFEEGKPFVEIKLDSLHAKKMPVVLGVSDGIYSEVKSGVTLKDFIKVHK